MSSISRRQILQWTGAAVGLNAFHLLGSEDSTATAPTDRSTGTSLPPFRYALNGGTLRGFKMPIEEEIDLAARTGYDAFEIWLQRLDQYHKEGKSLNDLKKRIEDQGLVLAGACAFFPWVVDDEAARTRGIEQMKREMDLVRQIGGNRISATAAGATDQRLDDFPVLGERYRTILEIGQQMEVVPQLEIWGRSKTFGCLADAVAIASSAGHPDAELLLDVYHLYRGQSSYEALKLLNGRKMTNFHMNDYPADPPRDRAEDRDRVYPGDGIAPLPDILTTLRSIGFEGFLSLEVFNPTYWETGDPDLLARTGLKKMKSIKCIK